MAIPCFFYFTSKGALFCARKPVDRAVSQEYTFRPEDAAWIFAGLTAQKNFRLYVWRPCPLIAIHIHVGTGWK